MKLTRISGEESSARRRRGSGAGLRVLALAVWLAPTGLPAAQKATLLNVSYDLSREFYQEVNPVFAAQWKQQNGETLAIRQSHGGSSKQAQSVVNGLEADVVTMNQPTDIDLLAKVRLLPANWASRLPNHSVPYTSTIVFVVRQGNPKHIKTWDDLIQPGVSVVIPNPKTSGNGRYSYLAAWGHVKKAGGTDEQAQDFLGKLFGNVPVLDTGGRGATITFANHGIGDVLLTFENEAAQIRDTFSSEAMEVVIPPDSILAENPVAWVDRNVERHHTEAVARAYLEFLYGEAGQELAAKYYFRPKSATALAKYPGRFPAVSLFTVAEVAGGWPQAEAVHFADGGIFDRIFQKP